ncbi:MAG TPA: GntR family transcriptional regulator [Beijerinckiaceae bacterium]|jgi:GntR family transcriptional regulator
MPALDASEDGDLALPGDMRLPRYERVREAIAARIRDGEWGPGEALPAELAMAAEYGVSLGTVRRAVSALVDERLLERRQGSGTYVRRGDFASSMFRFFRLHGADRQPLRPEGRMLSRDVSPAPAEAAQALGIAAGTAAIRMSRVRMVDSEPILAEDIVLPLEPFRTFLDVPDEAIGPLLYPVYASVCGQVIARAEETITFGPCPAPEARILRRKEGAPVVIIERIAYGLDNAPREWRRSYGPAERFQYKVEIR